MSPEPLLELSQTSIRALRVIGIVSGSAVAAFSVWGQRWGLLDFRPGGVALGEEVLPILGVAMAAAVLIAFRWELAGGAVAGFLGTGLAVFAVNQLVPWHAGALVAAFALPAVAWIFVELASLPPGRALIGVGITGALSLAGAVTAQYVYSGIWGPTHPESAAITLPDSPTQWVWSGAVTSSKAEVRALPRVDGAEASLHLSTTDSFDGADVHEADATYGSVVGFALENLMPSTTYFYWIEVDGQIDDVRNGRFTTFPEGPSSFTIAVGSCARVGSNGTVFDVIRDLDPLLYLVVGDIHYGDNNRDDVDRFREVMDLTLDLPAQSALYRDTPIAYVWDDHDYAGNDSGGSARGRAAAMAAYREYVPSYPLEGDDSAVFQAFTVGRVRIVMTDARSARDLDPMPGSDQMSMLGTAQREWLKDELRQSAETHALVIWVNPVPWIAPAEDGADHWGGYSDERRDLADHIVEQGIDNLVMISGDAHMVAIDDGTNTNYSSSAGGGFPLLHAAALDRPGSIKGGPYSHGAIAEAGQFATIAVEDDGSEMTVDLTGRNWQNQELMSFRFTPEPNRD